MPPPISRRIAIAVVAAGVAAACVALGAWQLRRLDERRTLNGRILRQRASTVERIGSASSAPAVPYRRVAADGRYDPEHEVIVFGRTLDGEPGHEVVTPLVLGDGTAVLVARGWVPFEMQTVPVPVAAPVTEEVEVRGSLVPDEGDGSTVPSADGVVRALDVEGIASTLPYPVFPLAIQLARQVPPQRGSLPVPIPLPELSEGPHLSYAIQWFSFAGIALVGGAILIRRDRRPPTAGP